MAALVGVFVLLLTGCFGDGRFVIGNGRGQVAPGVYYTQGAKGCGWHLYDAGSGSNVTGFQTPVAAERLFLRLPRDAPYWGGWWEIHSSGCGIWWRVTSSTPAATPPLAPKPSGMYRVPTDMARGTWTAPGGPYCRWERVRGYIADSDGGPHHTDGQQTVHVGTRWHGFRSTRCGTWHRTGP